MENEMIFWLDGFAGEAEGGMFIRNPLIEFFKKLEEKNINPVAIKYDGTWNLEILTEKKES